MNETDPHFEHNPRHSSGTRLSMPVATQVPTTTSTIPATQAYNQLDNELPCTIWTRIIDRFRYGKLMIVGSGFVGVLAVMFIVLGSLDVFHNNRYRSALGLGPSSGAHSKYEGDSWGSVSADHFDLHGKGDGTYYDPGVGILSCGTRFTAQDNVVALNHVDYGEYVNPNESPVCGACIKITGPLGSVKATIQDMCPQCGQGSLDLSPAVYGQVGDFVEGRIPVSWDPC